MEFNVLLVHNILMEVPADRPVFALNVFYEA